MDNSPLVAYHGARHARDAMKRQRFADKLAGVKAALKNFRVMVSADFENETIRVYRPEQGVLILGKKRNPSMKHKKHNPSLASLKKKVSSAIKKLTPSGRRAEAAIKRLKEASGPLDDPLAQTKRMIRLMPKKSNPSSGEVTLRRAQSYWFGGDTYRRMQHGNWKLNSANEAFYSKYHSDKKASESGSDMNTLYGCFMAGVRGEAKPTAKALKGRKNPWHKGEPVEGPEVKPFGRHSGAHQYGAYQAGREWRLSSNYYSSGSSLYFGYWWNKHPKADGMTKAEAKKFWTLGVKSASPHSKKFKKNPRLFSKAAHRQHKGQGFAEPGSKGDYHRYTVQGGPSQPTRVTDSLAVAKKLVAAMVKKAPHEWVTVYDTKTGTFPVEYKANPRKKHGPKMKKRQSKTISSFSRAKIQRERAGRKSNPPKGLYGPLYFVHIHRNGSETLVWSTKLGDAAEVYARHVRERIAKRPNGSTVTVDTVPGIGYKYAFVEKAGKWYSQRKLKERTAEQLEADYAKETGRKANPATASDALYKRFHGKESTKTVTTVEREHHHGNLAELGILQEIKVILNPSAAKSQQKLATLKTSDNETRLCSNEDGTQLFIVGGNQNINLNALGFPKAGQKEQMILGLADEITYRTRKKFDQFKTIDYFHGLGEDSGVKPYLAYKPRDKKLLIFGGRYKVKPEGIVD